jgi:type IV pilus assembly protein PilA
VENQKEEMKMEKRRSNKKGFTMIELMIVITVIGILAIVLLPRISGVRDEARTSGVETNLRAVQGQVELEIGKYESTSAGAVLLAARLKQRLEDDASMITNPITGLTGAATASGIGALGDVGAGNGVSILGANADASVQSLTATQSAIVFSEGTALDAVNGRLGRVAVHVFLDSQYNNRLAVALYGYDHNGRYIPESSRIIRR